MKRLALAAWCIGTAVALAPGGDTLAQSRGAQALEKLLQAADAHAAADAATAVGSAGVDVSQALARLKAGRSYGAAKAGEFTIRLTTSDGTVIETLADVPAGYAPARRWPVRVQLHGGVSRPVSAGEPRPLTPNRIAGEEAIYLQPRGHAGAEWWHLNQYEHMLALLDRVKRTYNVDENRVYLTGISDGATGVYFYAMKLPTPFSAFLPLNGNMRVLATPGTRANGQMYAGNMVNKPFFIVNGGRDPLYPVAAVAPHVEMIEAAGAEVTFHPQPEAGHDTSWWPTERDAFAQFVTAHPRQPHPAKLSWESERTDRYNRAHWLVIDQLGRRTTDDARLQDVNRFGTVGGDDRMFARTWPSGRVDVTREGNTFEARTRGVARFSLLLSPDVTDLSKPVVVRVNGEVVFNGPVREDLRTLLRWYARDLDRTMLYTAELPIAVP
jgi:poly(3-hydroxybutyrate) depolymerase